ncbi:DUF973 family protein [Acidianus sp. HS-5]|uniref:DUF973 family protein n=1 Tax=Acidianus sp. HS-5 TaxID=2886040 RepID=UPI001F2846EF|nr:DUF973 family protein [Acidianus sp. HS-5]BDC17790.1 hypothetical protein HS5_06800 [Acidianus sp. HS-5]
MSFQSDVIGLQKLKDASLWFIVVTILSFIGEINSTLALVFAIVDLAILFAVALPKLKDAFRTLASTGKDVSKGLTGINLIIPAIIIELLGGLIAIMGLLSVSPGLLLLGGGIALIAAVILFIAYLLIGLVIYSLGNFYNIDMLKIGGILIIIPFISFIGWILTYVGVDDAIRRAGGVIPQAPTFQPQVYQVGIGVIRVDGTANITLYSSTVVGIVSASIDNTLYNTVDITPKTLMVGNNQVTMRFIGVTGLIPGNNYYLTIYLSNGSSIKAMVTCTAT